MLTILIVLVVLMLLGAIPRGRTVEVGDMAPAGRLA
jgi:hypothetical protein